MPAIDPALFALGLVIAACGLLPAGLALIEERRRAAAGAARIDAAMARLAAIAAGGEAEPAGAPRGAAVRTP